MATSEVKATLAAAVRDLIRDWRTLAGVEVLVAAVAFIVITPMSGALLRMLVSLSGSSAVTDADIAVFLLITKSGLAALLLLVGTSLGIAVFGQACLMTVGLAHEIILIWQHKIVRMTSCTNSSVCRSNMTYPDLSG